MRPLHEHLARVGLRAGAAYGFALAGGYAIQANGMLERPSDDVDLFTVMARADEFEAGTKAVVEAYEAEGFNVEITKQFGTFARLAVFDPHRNEGSKVELSADWRANEPVWLAIGPVLHPNDAVANKMCALYGRAEARDFVDVDAAIESGRYTREQLLTLAHEVDSGFDRRMFGQAVGRVSIISDARFAEYEVTGDRLVGLRARFADWHAELV